MPTCVGAFSLTGFNVVFPFTIVANGLFAFSSTLFTTKPPESAPPMVSRRRGFGTGFGANGGGDPFDAAIGPKPLAPDVVMAISL